MQLRIPRDKIHQLNRVALEHEIVVLLVRLATPDAHLERLPDRTVPAQGDPGHLTGSVLQLDAQIDALFILILVFLVFLVIPSGVLALLGGIRALCKGVSRWSAATGFGLGRGKQEIQCRVLVEIPLPRQVSWQTDGIRRRRAQRIGPCSSHTIVPPQPHRLVLLRVGRAGPIA